MARRGRPTVEIALSPEERATLERWARRQKSSQALALRCRIVLGCADGLTHAEIAAGPGTNPGIRTDSARSWTWTATPNSVSD